FVFSPLRPYSGRWSAGIVDQYIDRRCRLEKHGAAFGRRDVRCDRRDLDAISLGYLACRFFQRPGGARIEHNIDTCLSELFGRSTAKPLRPAADDCAPAPYSEIHDRPFRLP